MAKFEAEIQEVIYFGGKLSVLKEKNNDVNMNGGGLPRWLSGKESVW